MFLSSSSSVLKLGVWGILFAFLLSLGADEAYAARRRGGKGKGKRAGAVRVKAKGGQRKGGGRQVRRSGGKRGLAVLPAGAAAGNVNVNAGIQDLGPANGSLNFNPVALGLQQGVGIGAGQLQVIPGFNNIALNSQGQVVELQPGALVNGQFIDINNALRQGTVSLNGSIVSGAQFQMLPGAQLEIRQFNQGNIPQVVSGQVVGNQVVGNIGGANQVRSLRQF